MRRQNRSLATFVVGDDWQAINRFAGSDTSYFRTEESRVARGNAVTLARNYRSVPAVVGLGNRVMAGRGVSAMPHRSAGAGAILLDTSSVVPTALEHCVSAGDPSKVALLRAVKAAASHPGSIVILTRRDAHAKRAQALIRQWLPSAINRCDFTTVHRFKGQERQTVILHGADKADYPLIHPLWVFDQVFGHTLDSIIDDERCLLYVAITRAADRLLITSPPSLTPFLRSDSTEGSLRRWGTGRQGALELPDSGAIVLVGEGRASFDRAVALKADGFSWSTWARRWWKHVPNRHDWVARLQGEVWAQSSSSLDVTVIEPAGQREFLVSTDGWVTRGTRIV
jgi:DNA helicase-4